MTAEATMLFERTPGSYILACGFFYMMKDQKGPKVSRVLAWVQVGMNLPTPHFCEIHHSAPAVLVFELEGGAYRHTIDPTQLVRVKPAVWRSVDYFHRDTIEIPEPQRQAVA